MQRIAMIDIGSNSARLVINHIYENHSYNMVYNQKETLRLSQKIDAQGELTAEGVKSTIGTLNNFAHMCKLFKTDKILAVCTAAIRNAANSENVLEQIKEHTDMQVQVLTGEQEAYYSFLGAVNSLDIEDALFFDLGGGSLELILVKSRKIVFAESIPLGAVNVTEKFAVNSKNNQEASKEFQRMYEFLLAEIGKILWLQDIELPLVGIGGTTRTLTKILQRRSKYNYHKLHNYSFEQSYFQEFFEALKRSTRLQRYKIPGLSNDRVDIILAGVSIIDVLFKVTASKKMITSGYGVRDGLFYEYYFSVFQEPNHILTDVLQHSVKIMQNLYHVDLEHAARVTLFADKMFAAWFALHRLPKNYAKILKVASLLHDVGISINYYNHEQHSAYLIESIQLFGLSHYEQIMSAVVACWHGGVVAGYFKNHIYRNFLKEEDWTIAKKLAAILAIAENLDYSQIGIIDDIFAQFSLDKNALILVSLKEHKIKPTMELIQVRKLNSWFKKEFGVELMVGVN